MSECPHTDNADKCTCEPGCGCPGYELPMTAREKVAELEAEVEHARAIAACSIGQPDRAENVAYREEMEAKLRSARAEAEKSTVRDKVARAINPNDPDIVIRTGIADAAIAAHLDALKADGWVMFQPSEVTRIDIIGEQRVKEMWADECFAVVQDDGHTLKMFPYGEGRDAQAARAKALVDELKERIAAKAESAE